MAGSPKAAEAQAIADLVDDGRLDQAAFRAARRVEARPEDATARADLEVAEWLRDTDLPAGRAAPWKAAYRLSAKKLSQASPEVAAAVRGHLARGLTRAAEVEGGRAALVGGEPPGAFLLDAGLPDEAAASLFGALAEHPHSGTIPLLLANALHRLGRAEEARDLYRRALRVAPLEVDLARVEDDEVRDLLPVAKALGLPGDPRPWIPAVGWLEDVLPLSALDPVPGAGFGDGTRAYDLLIAHKGARSHGERAAIVKDLEVVAPSLHAALKQARKLDPTPAGSA